MQVLTIRYVKCDHSPSPPPPRILPDNLKQYYTQKIEVFTNVMSAHLVRVNKGI